MQEQLWYPVILIFAAMEDWLSKLENLLKQVFTPDNLKNLLQQLEKDMEAQLASLNTLFANNMSKENANLSLFPIVVYFDEMVQTTLPVDYLSYWQQNFQEKFFQTDIGGDLFYDKLDDILTKRNIDLFVYEVFYFCLNDGFKGKYANDNQKREQYKKEIVALIPKVESQQPEDLPPPELRTLEQISFWSYLWNTLVVVLCIYVIYYFLHGYSVGKKNG